MMEQSEPIGFFRSKRTCLILTGASKGFGRVLAIEFAKSYSQQFSRLDEDQSPNGDDALFLFVLIARSETSMETLGEELRSIDLRCKTIKIVADLSQANSIEMFENVFADNRTFDHYILIHNAGSTGSPKLCSQVRWEDYHHRNDYYRLNLHSMVELTAAFMRLVPLDSQKHLINISSLAAIKPIKGLMDYCVAKAARLAYFKQLAEELIDDPKYRILSYAPGPLDTEMFRALQNCESGHVKEMFEKLIPLQPSESATKLLKLVKEDQYINGQHIDFYDF